MSSQLISSVILVSFPLVSSVVSGTPEEDAFRRDLTINSLFYNLMTEKVEDFTKMGIEDLRNGIIRCGKKYTRNE